MLKACAAVEVQLDAYTCSITTSPSYLKLRKVDLNRPNGFLPEIYDISRIKVGCICVQILCLPQLVEEAL